MENRFREAAIKARQMTNKQLATEIASLTKLTRDDLNELLPEKKDKEAFVQLMNTVQDETDMDNKLAYLRDNMQTAGTIMFKLLKAIV